jgi:hypothetical protein
MRSIKPAIADHKRLAVSLLDAREPLADAA